MEGIAIAIKTNTGKVAHKNSNKCPCKRNRSVYLFIQINNIIKKIINIIIVKIIIVKSWK